MCAISLHARIADETPVSLFSALLALMLHYRHFLTDLPARTTPVSANLADYGLE